MVFGIPKGMSYSSKMYEGYTRRISLVLCSSFQSFLVQREV